MASRSRGQHISFRQSLGAVCSCLGLFLCVCPQASHLPIEVWFPLFSALGAISGVGHCSSPGPFQLWSRTPVYSQPVQPYVLWRSMPVASPRSHWVTITYLLP